MVIKTTWMFRTAIFRVKTVPSLLSYFKTLNIGLSLGTKPTISCSAVKCSTNGANPAVVKEEICLLSKYLSDNPGEFTQMICWTSPWFQNVFYKWEMKCHATSVIASIGIKNSPVMTPWIIINIKLWLLHLQSGWFQNNHYNKLSHLLYLMKTNLSQNIMYNLMGA